jgi:6-phosphogluconolactonase (cycloisomerase 2 family)
MSKKIGGVIALVGMCALSLFLLSCGSSSSRPSGLLYVLTQGSNGTGDNVSSFAIDLGTGNLSLINSNASTCKPSGGSCGLPLNILLDPKGAVAFVLNQGIPSESTPPTIYAYTVNSDGSLGTPTPAATLTPGDTAVAMTRDAAGQFLFVIDKGSDPSAANCQFLPPNFPNVACASISVFTMQSGSTSLSAVAGSPFPVGRIPSALSAVTFTAPGTTTAQEFLYVTFNSDPALHNDNTLSAYSVDSSGKPNDLTPNLPYATQPNPISVLAVNTGQDGGLFVYVGNQGSVTGAVSAFQVCTVVNAVCKSQDLTKLVPVGTPTSVGQNPVGMVVDPTNNFLYVVNQLSSNVYGFRINTTAGTLTPLSPANLPTGSQPVAMAMHSSGRFLYTSNSGSSNISGFTVSTTSGSMSSLPAVNSPAGPSGMAAR